ncbi:MAG: zf-HC2 domain-containing protein [Gemmatimonadaceae bacterium]|nr:zf-HC2 domain-containing protein [Gemmatimonadaceae bacterium]
MMNDCPNGEVRDLLPLYAAGLLGAADHSLVAHHVARCADCTEEVRLLRAVARAYAVPAPSAASIVGLIPARRATRPNARLHRQSVWRVAATFALMIAGTATYVAVRPTMVKPGDADSLAAVTGAGTRVTGPASGAAALGSATEPGIHLGVGLSDLTEAQLEALLASMEGIEGNVLADPGVLVKPIVEDPDPSGGGA